MLVIDPATGAATVTLPAGELALRWPTVAEWAQITDRYLDADEALRDVDETKRGRWRRENAPFAAAFAALIATLTDTAELDPAKLPLWCDDATIYTTLRDLWATARITTRDAPIPMIPNPDEEM